MIYIEQDYQIPDELWKKIEPLLPPPKRKKKSGRPREDDRKMMNGIFYVLRTGCQWKALPRSLGASSNQGNTVDSKWVLKEGTVVSITIVHIPTNQIITTSMATVKRA